MVAGIFLCSFLFCKILDSILQHAFIALLIYSQWNSHYTCMAIIDWNKVFSNKSVDAASCCTWFNQYVLVVEYRKLMDINLTFKIWESSCPSKFSRSMGNYSCSPNNLPLHNRQWDSLNSQTSYVMEIHCSTLYIV